MTQANALAILKMGHNVFLTGSAGSGKTYVLNAFVQHLRDHGIAVAVTASTGIAATHLGGMTIHAWSGIGIKESLSDWDIDQLEAKKYLWDGYEKTRVLVIDEVSMLSGSFLDMLDRTCRSFKRKPDVPFGGIQLVLCGDLFQLPPISKTSEQSDYVVYSNAWKNSNLAMCYLTEQHRQEDGTFLDILNAIRAQNVGEDHIEHLQTRMQQFDAEQFTSITKLFTHNADVDKINQGELDRIDDEPRTFTMTSSGKEKLIESLKKSCLAPEILSLKQGAEIMFVRNNFEEGFVNGTRGIVIGFDKETGFPMVESLAGKRFTVKTETWAIEDHSKILASITQIPLRHAWAITVHKSQGMSLDAAVVDLSKTFTYGMGYVALSRVRTLAGLYLIGMNPDALLLDPRMTVIDAQLQALSDRAEARLETIAVGDLEKMHNEVIVKLGGTLEKASKKIRKKKIHDTLGRPTHEISVDFLNEGKTLEEVALLRELTVGTIIGHVEKALRFGKNIDVERFKPAKKDLKIIKGAFDEVGYEALTPVKAYLELAGHDYTYDTLKLARLFLKI